MATILSEIEKKLKSLKLNGIDVFAVACSGGPDSMALVMLAKQWAKAHGIRMVAVTVDHGLREGSAEEAKRVAGWLKKLGIMHYVLRWEGTKPTRNIQEAARDARYQLLADFCHTQGIKHLFVGHTRDDQAETFLLRLARGSGVDGLSAMSELAYAHGLTIVRPLLDVQKAALQHFLREQHQSYIDDPSNANEEFDRVKIRKLLPELSELGLTPSRLAKTARLMGRARSELESRTAKFLSRHSFLAPEGYALLHSLDASEEIALRSLAALTMLVGGHRVRPRLSDLERLYTHLREPRFKGATLQGCMFVPEKKSILIHREPHAVAHPLALESGVAALWDERFAVRFEGEAKRMNVGTLGQEDWLTISKLYKLKSQVPTKAILYTLPAFRDGKGELIAVPHLDLQTEGLVCNAEFIGFTSSAVGSD